MGRYLVLVEKVGFVEVAAWPGVEGEGVQGSRTGGS